MYGLVARPGNEISYAATIDLKAVVSFYLTGKAVLQGIESGQELLTVDRLVSMAAKGRLQKATPEGLIVD